LGGKKVRRALSVATFLMLVLSTLSTFAPQVRANPSTAPRSSFLEVQDNPKQQIVDLKAASYLPQGVLEHTLLSGVAHYDQMMGAAYNPATDTYWTVDGGTTPSYIYEQSPDGTFLINGTVPLDGRAIVYRPEDGNIYIRSFAAGLYRLNLPFDGTVTEVLPNIFMDGQCGFTPEPPNFRHIQRTFQPQLHERKNLQQG